MINSTKLSEDLTKAGILFDGCNDLGIVLYQGFEIQNRPDVKAVIDAYDPNDYDTLSNIVQNYLDSTVQEKGYANIVSCVSYISSNVTQWFTEAQTAANWRDECWNTFFPLLVQYISHDLPYPTEEELISQLPQIVWPN